MARSRRCPACSAIRRERNARCEHPSRSASARTASNASSRKGTLSVAKSQRICFRKSSKRTLFVGGVRTGGLVGVGRLGSLGIGSGRFVFVRRGIGELLE